MRPNHVRAPRNPTEQPIARRRFRIEKLEERIAPKKGGNGTHNCGGGGSQNDLLPPDSNY